MGLQVVIPIAGLGTRLRPHTYAHPKPLLPVAGKPILAHIVDQLQGRPVDEVIFIVGHLGDQVERWAAEACPFPARFVVQQELRGQAHALSLVAGLLDRPTVIIFGDTIFEADLSVLDRDGEDGRLYTQEVDDPRRFGIAVVRDGRVERLVEKPTEPVGNLAVVGIYYVREPGALMSAVDDVIARGQQLGGEYYLADALQGMIDRGARFVVSPTQVWADCGTVPAILETNRWLLGHGRDQMPTGATQSTIVPPVNIHPSATIVDSILGPNVSVGANTTIRRSIVDDSIVGDGAELEACTLSGSLIGSRARVSDLRGRVNLADDSEVKPL